MFKTALINASAKLHDLMLRDQIAEYEVIGAFALTRWVAPRATADIDFAIKLNKTSLEILSKELNGNFFIGEVTDPLLGSVTFNEDMVPIQLIQFPLAWETVAFDHKDTISIDTHNIPMIGWQSLIMLKLYAGSSFDLEDAKQLLQSTKRTKKDLKYLKQTAEKLRVSKRLERVLESI